MAFQTGTSTSIDNLMSQLDTFLQANGWTRDFLTAGDPGRGGWSKNSMFFAAQWTDATDGGTLALYQNTSNDDSTNVWLSTGDSGLGAASALAVNFDNERCVNVFAGPHTAYWFFEQDSGPAYIHVVVEVDAGRFRHFGIGEIEKIGDWTGGEYVYGHYWTPSLSQLDQPLNTFSSPHLDAYNGNAGARRRATIRIDGFPEQSGDPSAQWGAIGASQSYGFITDRAGEPILPIGGCIRGGIMANLCSIRWSPLNSFKPLLPMVLHVNDLTGSPDTSRLLGSIPDQRVVNMRNIDPGETFTVAGETWYVFPLCRKQSSIPLDDTENTVHHGVAYRQETA